MSSETSSSPSGKRCRDPEDEVYVDNLHSHKRYLSEMMASSLNGLTVGESLPENLMESPARSEGIGYPRAASATWPKCRSCLLCGKVPLRDEVSSQYSPMSEDSDDSRYYDNSLNASMPQHDSLCNLSSPVSPHRQQKPLVGFSSPPPANSYPSLGCSLTAVAYSQPRQRSSDSEGRFPSSPSDICQSADLRRAALMRSVQMRTQPPGPPTFELPYNTAQESIHNNSDNIEESEDRPCSYMKPLIDGREFMDSARVVDEGEFQDSARITGILEECSSMGLLESEASSEKCYRVSNFNLKDDESRREVFEKNTLESTDVLPSKRSKLGGNASNR